MTLTHTPTDESASAEAEERRRASAGRSIAVVLGALLVAALLNAEHLARVADQQRFGWRRDVAVAVAEPIESVADAVGLTAPRRWLDDLLEDDDLGGSDTFGGGLARPPSIRDRMENPVTTTTAPATTPTTVVARRTPTKAKPLRVLFAGDSLIGNLADAFARRAQDDGRVRVSTEVHIATGLARPDVLDWPTFLDRRVRKHHAEVVFMMFGGNDDQPLRGGPGDPPSLLSPEWKREYRRRVAIMMDVATTGQRQVVWIGVPVVERDRLNRARRVMNQVARAEARGRSLVTFVNLDEVLAPDGRYADRVRLRDGRVVEVRAPDGVHVSHTGADVLTPMLWRTIAAEWHLTKRR